MPQTFLNRRQLLQQGMASTALLAGGGTAATFIGVSAAKGQSLARIDMQLGWLASNGLLGEIAAAANGYFEEEGLRLEITPGGPNVDGVANVASGRAGIGQVSSSPSIMMARAAGIPVKAFAAGYHTHPFTYFSLPDAPIREPRDMIGKTIATQPTAFILLRALLAANDIPESDVEIVNMGADMNQLLTGQAQAVTGWLTNTAALSILGDDRVELMLWDAGLQLYANVYYTTDRMLAENGEQLAAFTRASARGWGFVRENPEASVDMLLAAYPNLDRDAEMEAVHAVIGFSFNDDTPTDGWGAMTMENWERQIGTYADLGQFDGPAPALEDVATLEILEATADIRRAVG